MRYTLMTAVAVLVLATPAIADEMDFILINGTGKVIKQVEVASTGTDTWQANKVEEGIQRTATLANGARMTVHYDQVGTQCRYDIRATFADDTTAVWPDVDLCDNVFITVRYRNGAPVVSAN